MADFSNLMVVVVSIIFDDNDLHTCSTGMIATKPKVHRNERNHLICMDEDSLIGQLAGFAEIGPPDIFFFTNGSPGTF